MSNELLEIQPREFKFIVEPKKQSSCSVQLFNRLSHYVAFKVKTTNPKKYCVRPNTGIIGPKSTYNFIVTMQAQKVAVPDLTCKDKFLIQSTVVAVGTSEEDITSSVFAKDNGKYVEESKLRVVLTSPPHSPVLSPINKLHDQVPAYDTLSLKDQVLHGDENITPQLQVTEGIVEPKLENAEPLVAAKALDPEPVKDVEVLEFVEDIENLKSKISELELKLNEVPAYDKLSLKDQVLHGDENITPQLQVTEDIVEPKLENPEPLVAAKTLDPEPVKDVEVLELVEDIQNLKSKISKLELKLNEAEATISKLIEERRLSTLESKKLQQELALMRSKKGERRVQVGFPFIIVCVVALFSAVLGYLLHY